MKNEDLERKVIKRYDKDYYQTVDRIKQRIQTKLDDYVFNDKATTRKTYDDLRKLIEDVLMGYAEHNLFENWGLYITKNLQGIWQGTIVMHKKDYSTFSHHPFVILKKDKSIHWQF